MKSKQPVSLSAVEARALIRILGEYQGELESVIDSHTVGEGSVVACLAGTPAAMLKHVGADVADMAIVEEARRKWKRAERYVGLLSEGRK